MPRLRQYSRISAAPRQSSGRASRRSRGRMPARPRGGALSRALVAERAGAGLETGAAESTPQADDMERHPGRRAAARDDLAVPIGVGAAGAVVDMQGREAQLQAEARV